ncbi:choice-of-anchor J domain-containing protein [Flavobacterium hauense]
MKKNLLFLFFLLLSISGSAQLAEESFESWTPGQGPANWKILQNAIGPNVQWAQSVAGNVFTPPYTGQHAAYLNLHNVSTGIPEDYLVTPEFNAPVNGRINFYSRLTLEYDQGSVYKVKILPAGADADDINNYVELQSWTELEINPAQSEYTKITVLIPQIYENTNVRVAFVMAADNGDRWLIDDVEVVAECLMAENLVADAVTQTSAAITWDHPNGATQFMVELVDDAGSPTGVGTPYNGTQPYVLNNLTPGVEYRFYVRAICADGGKSDWASPVRFMTKKPGDDCQNPKVITSLPYTNTDDTIFYFDNINGAAGGCGIPVSQKFLNGNDIFYAYTATQTGAISINLTGLTETYAGIFVYASCADIGVSCYAGAVNDHTSPTPDINIPVINVTAGQTYYIVISTWFAQSTGFKLNIQQESCDRPTGVIASMPTYNGITLKWTSSLSSWEYVVQQVGTGLPMGAGQAITNNPITLTSLDPSSQYEFYVRANCGNGTFSSWAGPLVFNTQCTTFPVPYFEGFNSGSESQFCWTVADNNNDGVVWDMDFTYSAFEGDQSAKFDVGTTSDNDDMLISPAIQLTGNERLKFHYKSQQYGAGTFKVMASVTGTAPQDFTIEVMPLTTVAVDNFTEKIINLTSLPAGPVHFAWYVPAGLNGGYEMMIDNVIVETMPACAQPTDIASDNVSDSSAHLSWTAGNNETAWEILVGTPQQIGTPGNDTVGIPCTTTEYNAAGLIPNDTQTAFVRSVCGPAGKSAWTGPYFFTTKCTALPVPFHEGFNSDSTTEACWRVVNGNGDWAEWALSEMPAFEGDEAASIYTGNAANNDWLISPALILTGNERLKFHYRVANGGDGAGFRVMLSTASADLDDFTTVLVPETTYNNEDYRVIVVSLAAYTGPVYLAWQVPPTSQFGSDLLIDNVIVEPMPACPEPLYVEVSDITPTSAQVTWTPGNTETEWELFVNLDGEPAPTTGITVTALPYTLTALPDGTPLTSGTHYQVAVKAICNSTESSAMSDKIEFTTLITNDECATAITVPVNAGAACVVSVSGTLTGATTSTPQDSPCGEWVSVNEDVWFEFTATAATHTVTFFDMPAGSSPFMYIIYKGDDCDNLEEVSFCNSASAEYTSTQLLEGLAPGAKYKIRAFNTGNDPVTTTFKVCVKVPVTPIAVSTTQYTVEQLVNDVLFEGSCAQISNITWSTGTNYPDPDNVFGDNPNGIAYFNKNDSGFPFDEGIVMTTGDVTKVPGPDYRAMEQGSAVWPGDTDIDAVMEGFLGAPPFQPSTNASVIEFDFVPSMPTFSLDFMFASEEYGDYIQCYSYDTFAILLTDANGNTQNIAVIPGTQIPISVFNISGAGYTFECPGYNLPWFGQYNVFGNQDYSQTSFAGQTVVMTATANVLVNQPYHIKIAIAETDNNLDSGVFIKAGVEVGAGTVDLGADLLVATNTALCIGQTATIESGLDDATFDFVWKRNGTVIPNETAATLVVNQPGEYAVTANVTGYNCLREDSVIVEFYPSVEDITGSPQDSIICDADGFAEFDIASNTALILDGLNAADYTVTYHASAEAAADNTAALTSPYTNTVQFEQVIYARIAANATPCYAVRTFTIRAQDLTPQFTIEGDFIACRAEDVTLTVKPVNFEIGDATFTWIVNGNTLDEDEKSIQATVFDTYSVTVTIQNCSHTESVKVEADDSVIEIGFMENCENNIYTLEAIDVDGSFDIDAVSYAWTGPKEFESTERKFTPPTVGVYKVIVTTAEGCTGEGEFTVEETTCEIPKGISPNNDGFNDEFDLSMLTVKKLILYNRYGQEVYSKSNYTKEWKGQDSNGKELPTGTYFYMLELAQGESKTGWVYINRQD